MTQSIKSVKKTVRNPFSPDELENKVYAAVQARGGNPNIVKVLAWDRTTREILTEDMGRCEQRLALDIVIDSRTD